MKLALLGLILSTLASALPADDIRLQYGLVPNGTKQKTPRQTVAVHANGQVIRKGCSLSEQAPCPDKVLATWSEEKMEEINDLIEEARTGHIMRTRNRAMCIVAPSFIERESADNDKILLSSGHFCIGFQTNESPAAKKLVSLLSELHKL